jgi:hypothetical protein
MMKNGLLTLLLLTLSNLAWAGFEGTYKCHGSDPYLNSDYKGTIVVTPQNAVYSLTMDYDTGESSVGTGGEYDKNVMFVVFQNKKDLKQVGLEQYQFSDNDTKISGYWVYLGKDKLGREICEKVPDAKAAADAKAADAKT